MHAAEFVADSRFMAVALGEPGMIIGWVAFAAAILAASLVFADPASDRRYEPGETFRDVCRFLDAGKYDTAHAQPTGVQKAPRHEVAGS